MTDLIVHALWLATAGLFVVMTATFLFAHAVRNYGIVDAVWTISFLPLAVWFTFALPGQPARDLLLVALVAAWSVRLGGYLTLRISREHPAEDRRYAALRERWKPRVGLKMFNFYQVQALFTLVLSTPLLLVAANARAGFTLIEIIGVAVVMIGVAGEALADAQLRRFKRERSAPGAVCDRGLWRYSRHPNYFFEWVVWVGFALIALAAPWGWLGLLSPAVMLHLLLNLTGVPATEAALLERRGDAYRAYQRTTNAFFPGPPRAGSSV